MTTEQTPTGTLAPGSPAFLERLFTGRLSATSAFGSDPLEAQVAPYPASPPLPADHVAVTVNGFSETATLVCRYEPRFHWNGTTNVPASPPPKGTPCLVVFSSNEPQNIGWALAFVGWPLE